MKKPDWKADDASALREFASRNPKFMDALRSFRPRHEGSNIEARAINSAVIEGFERAIEHIEELMTHTPESDPAPYLETHQ